jgi:hypothetical protein
VLQLSAIVTRFSDATKQVEITLADPVFDPQRQISRNFLSPLSQAFVLLLKSNLGQLFGAGFFFEPFRTGGPRRLFSAASLTEAFTAATLALWKRAFGIS